MNHYSFTSSPWDNTILETLRQHKLTTLLLIIGNISQLEKKKGEGKEEIYLLPEKFQIFAVTGTFLNSVHIFPNIKGNIFPLLHYHQWSRHK